MLRILTQAGLLWPLDAVKITAPAGQVEAAPLLALIINILNARLALTVNPGDDAEKVELPTSEESFSGPVETMEGAIAEKQKDL